MREPCRQSPYWSAIAVGWLNYSSIDAPYCNEWGLGDELLVNANSKEYQQNFCVARSAAM